MTKNAFAAAAFAGLFAVTLPTHGANLEQSCKRLLNQTLRVWTMASVTGRVRAFAARRKFDPLRVRGDFDGDGRQDIALLIQQRAQPVLKEPDRMTSTRVAVCLAKERSVALRLIEAPYCDDFIYLVRRGGDIFDIDAQDYVKHPFDAIGTTCFGKAGAVFILEGESFRQIVNSD